MKALAVHKLDYNSLEWLLLRDQVKARDNHTCQHCGQFNYEKGNRLEVHHQEYNWKAKNPLIVPIEHLITLCKRCHDAEHERIDNDKHRMSTIFNYEGASITFKDEAGTTWVNATEMAKKFRKEPAGFLRTAQTKGFISILERSVNMQTVKTVKGDGGGTWMHEKLALRFAAWLSPEFELWCFDRIQELLTTGKVEVPKQSKEMEALLSHVPVRKQKNTTIALDPVLKGQGISSGFYWNTMNYSLTGRSAQQNKDRAIELKYNCDKTGIGCIRHEDAPAGAAASFYGECVIRGTLHPIDNQKDALPQIRNVMNLAYANEGLETSPAQKQIAARQSQLKLAV